MYVYMDLLQLRSTPVGASLLSLAALLFNRLPRCLLPNFSRPPMSFDSNESSHAVLSKR